MPKCPKCGEEMVKAEKSMTLLVAGDSATFSGLKAAPGTEQAVITAGTVYCPKCNPPARSS